MVTASSFWAGKRVFVTGHTGFKGSWLSSWLRLLGAEITGFSLEPPTSPSLFVAAGLSEHVHHVIGDIRDKSALDKAMNETQPDMVIHLAAQPLVRLSYDDPHETFSVNVMGTLNVLQTARDVDSIKAVLNVTTDKCYENREWLWAYREDEALGGYDPYSASKACSEVLTSSYRNSFLEHGFSLATARAGNVIGGGDWGIDRLIPDLIRGFSSSEKVKIRNPSAIRPWQHVLDALEGYLILAEQLYEKGNDYAQAWNFGPDHQNEMRVVDIVEQSAELWAGQPAYQIVESTDNPHEARYLKLDSTKARTLLGWCPRWNINKTMEMTIEFYKELVHGCAGSELLDLINTQIEDHQSRKPVR